MKNTMIEQLSKLTTIPNDSLERLKNIEIMCITNDFYETLKTSNKLTTTDVGIGTLNILYDNGAVKFKFVPSAKLEEEIIQTAKGKQSKLEKTLDKSLKDSLVNTYKDLF